MRTGRVLQRHASILLHPINNQVGLSETLSTEMS